MSEAEIAAILARLGAQDQVLARLERHSGRLFEEVLPALDERVVTLETGAAVRLAVRREERAQDEDIRQTRENRRDRWMVLLSAIAGAMATAMIGGVVTAVLAVTHVLH